MNLYLKPDSLDWALSHIETFGDTDIFPLPFEFLAIRKSWPTTRDYLAQQDLFNWRVRPFRQCLSPKHRYGFRIATQLDPLDIIIFTALVYELGPDLESSRIAAKHQIVHSYRYNPSPSGRMYDPKFSLDSFKKTSMTMSRLAGSSYVVMADIADFYPRIYSHMLENAVGSCTRMTEHAKVLGKLLNSWNYSVSYGIPVGPAASRLLAERVIADVDAALQSEGYRFCRFVDDYRIFCRDRNTAYRALIFLAHTLFQNHGLTLQQTKTQIVSKSDFFRIMARTEHEHEGRTLTQHFRDILQHLGISNENPYQPLDFNSLDTTTQERVNALNLIGILTEQIQGDAEIDPFITRFALRRLSQINDASALPLVMDHLHNLYPVFKDVLAYITGISNLSGKQRHQVGKALLGLIGDTEVGQLEYHRCWILNTFTKDHDWNNEKAFTALYNEHADQFTRRELIAALGRAHQEFWFRTNKKNFDQFNPWEKRAFLAAASCLPGDEPKFFYRSVRPRLDHLDQAVCDWAEEFRW